MTNTIVFFGLYYCVRCRRWFVFVVDESPRAVSVARAMLRQSCGDLAVAKLCICDVLCCGILNGAVVARRSDLMHKKTTALHHRCMCQELHTTWLGSHSI